MFRENYKSNPKRAAIRSGIFFGVFMFVLFTAYETVTYNGSIHPGIVLLNAFVWSIGGVAYGLLMYRWMQNQIHNDSR